MATSRGVRGRRAEPVAAAGAAPAAGDIVDRLVRGDRLALARAISIIEDAEPEAPHIVKTAFPHGDGAAPIVGLTGPSGSGKSTLADRLTTAYRAAGVTVGVLAIDPTSPFTGGALLGDRVRMQRHTQDAGVFVRSMATRGALGGLAAATYDALTLLAAAGFERLLIETVGVGQDEVDVAAVADTTCVILTPGTGDEIQAIKAGIMEVADILVLNKTDLQGADRAEAQLRAWIDRAPDDGWTAPIVRTVAVETRGIDDLVEAIRDHEAWLSEGGRAAARRRALAELRLDVLLRDRLLARARRAGFGDERRAALIDAIVAGEIDPHSAAEQVVRQLFGDPS